MKNTFMKKWSLLVLVSVIIAFTGYWFVLQSVFLKPAALALWQNTSLLFIIVAALFFFVFRRSAKTAWILGLLFAVFLFALPLLYLWTSGYSDNGIIGGLLPYKDGKYYQWGVQMILRGVRISKDGVQAAGRPLFPGFLSVFQWFFGGNLKWSIASIVGFTALVTFLTAYFFAGELGSASAALAFALLYFYIKPFLGFTMSELAGFTFGCLGLILMWKAAKHLSIPYLILGLTTTMFAVSIRAGAFFIFPMFVLWAGWAFRGEKRFSWRIAMLSSAIIAAAFLFFNFVYPKLAVESGAIPNGNFAYALYGQVRGGVGWNEAIKATGTRDPKVVLLAAWDFFLRHPQSFPIGIMKSYRDFFLPGSRDIFPMANTWSGNALKLLWLMAIAFSIYLFPVRKKHPTYMMLLASFIGIFLSIPFLPPVDGGSRFYASTMGFFFLFVAYPLSILTATEKPDSKRTDFSFPIASYLAIGGLVLSVAIPLFLQRYAQTPDITPVQCPSGQVSFAAIVPPDSYIDLIPARTQACGLIPEVCLDDFSGHGRDAKTDDFFQTLVQIAASSKSVTRVALVENLVDENTHYLLGTNGNFPSNAGNQLISGCATEIKTKHQSIYRIETTVPQPAAP